MTTGNVFEIFHILLFENFFITLTKREKNSPL